MARRLWQKLQAWIVMRKLLTHPVYQAAFMVIHRTLSNDKEGLGKYANKETKETIAAQLINSVSKIIASPNPIMANREHLVTATLAFANFQVLIMDETSEDRGGLRGKPGITGQLKPRLAELAKTDRDLRNIAFELGENLTQTDLTDAFVLDYWRAALDMGVYNAMRLALGDRPVNLDVDLVPPFCRINVRVERVQYRKQLGMPDVLAEHDDYRDMASLKHSTYVDFVLKGARFPNLEFEEHYKK